MNIPADNTNNTNTIIESFMKMYRKIDMSAEIKKTRSYLSKNSELK